MATIDRRSCVLSLGVSSPSPPQCPRVLFQDYARGIEDIARDLERHGFSGGFVRWTEKLPDGSPDHQDSPFAFKPFCFTSVKKRGYRLALWVDASIRLKRNPQPLFDLIADRGYLIFEESHSVGEYCKDEALGPLGINREESFQIPCCRAAVLGLDLDHPVSIDFLRAWMMKALDGVTFPGPKWSGVHGWPQTASEDSRVKGHRHDQTAASVIALQRGMDSWQSSSLFLEYFAHERHQVRDYQRSPSPGAFDRAMLPLRRWRRAWRRRSGFKD